MFSPSKPYFVFMDRRTFLTAAATGACAGTVLGALPAAADSPGYPARFWEPGIGGNVICRLCPWECVIPSGGRGNCGTRLNRDGRLVTLAYGNPCSMNNDPVEKKPLYHFLPGTEAFSIATGGCNINCAFCQNWQIARARPDALRTYAMDPGQVAAAARKAGSRTVAFTYSEPVVFYEYVAGCARAARKAGLRSAVISNGFVNPAPLRELCPLIDAYKVDLKAFSDTFYREVCGGRLQPVLDTLVTLAENGVWTEIVYLVLPGMNDGGDEVRRMAAWIVDRLGPDVPLHFSRFHPAYRMTRLPATPVRTLERLHGIVRKAGVRYAYIGNVPGHAASATRCHACGEPLLERKGYGITGNGLADGACAACGTRIPGVWS